MLDSRGSRRAVNIWPGFVDALATLLLVLVFLLLVFTISQFYLGEVLSGRNRALESLRLQVDELAETLALKRAEAAGLSDQLEQVRSRLQATLAQRDELRLSLRSAEQEAQASREQAERLEKALAAAEQKIVGTEQQLQVSLKEIASLQADIAALRATRDKLEARVGELASALEFSQQTTTQLRDRSKRLESELAETTRLKQQAIEQRETRIEDLVAEVAERDRALEQQQQLTAQARARVEALRGEIEALRSQLSSIAAALEASEATMAEQKAQIKQLGERLNSALVQRVRELSRYRSEFFGRLREILGDRSDIRIVGDRFMFQSELFFESGSAALGTGGKDKLATVAKTLTEVTAQIPPDLDWILMVEGHTDERPIQTERFPSNWELSTARATSIVHFLIDRGIPARRLSAAGYGPYQPLAEGDSPEAYARNRRIEFKLTSR